MSWRWQGGSLLWRVKRKARIKREPEQKQERGLRRWRALNGNKSTLGSVEAIFEKPIESSAAELSGMVHTNVLRCLYLELHRGREVPCSFVVNSLFRRHRGTHKRKDQNSQNYNHSGYLKNIRSSRSVKSFLKSLIREDGTISTRFSFLEV